MSSDRRTQKLQKVVIKKSPVSPKTYFPKLTLTLASAGRLASNSNTMSNAMQNFPQDPLPTYTTDIWSQSTPSIPYTAAEPYWPGKFMIFLQAFCRHFCN